MRLSEQGELRNTVIDVVIKKGRASAAHCEMIEDERNGRPRKNKYLFQTENVGDKKSSKRKFARL